MKLSPKDLKQVIVFQNATDEDLRVVLENGHMRAVQAGGFFFFQGDPAEYLYILTGGQVKLMQANLHGQQVNLRTLYPLQMFGALGVVRAGAVYPASAQALEDSFALALKSEFLRGMLETRPYLSFDLMNLMTAYIQEMQNRYRESVTEKVEQRIARVLLRLAGQSGKRVDEGVRIELSFSRQDLAEMAGTTFYTVSRILSAWEKQGLISTGRERVTLTNPHGVMKIAEGL